MGEDANDGLVVFVKKKTSAFELGEECLDRATYCLQLLEDDVIFDIWHRPQASGLDTFV